MATTPTGDETLTPKDAVKVLEELLPAQNQSFALGLKLMLPLHVVESICEVHTQPRDRLLQVIIAFLKQEQTGPTWRVIADALRSPAVNLPLLAKEVEAAHFPDPTSARDVVPETITAAESVASTTTDISGDVVKSKAPPELSSVAEVKNEIEGLRGKFKSLKDVTIQCLERCCLAVMTVVYMLSEIRSVEQHKVFLEEKHKVLFASESYLQLFSLLNLYWNYLSPDLLDQLLEELCKKESSFKSISEEMGRYKSDLQKFRQRTTLKLFCEADTSTECDPPPEFRRIVVKHDWPDTVTLDDVEKFRRRYSQTYNLQRCAMMLHSVRPGTFTVTWFVPVTVIDILRKKRAVKVYKEFEVSRLEIYVQATAVCVYQTTVQRQAPSILPSTSTSSSSSALPSAVKSGSVGKEAPVEKDYPFVEQPSDDFFCPVTFGLLLQPHLTSCCGNHLSQEAATRIQREGGACPLCKMPRWTTMLSKHFQRQVNQLHVFCCHEDGGCGWQGELSDFEHHVQSCPMTDQPLMTELLKHPLYGGEKRLPSQPTVPAVSHSIPTKKAVQGKKEHLYKILVIGDLGTGKTSIVKRYTHQFFLSHYRATIGVDFALKVLNWDNSTTIRLQLSDIAGQERCGKMTRIYYKEAVGAFVVYDVTRVSTFEAVQMWKADLDNKVILPNGKSIPAVLLANKCDLASEGFLSNINQLDEYCREKGFHASFETSAKENIGIDEAARYLVAKVLENDEMIEHPQL